MPLFFARPDYSLTRTPPAADRAAAGHQFDDGAHALEINAKLVQNASAETSIVAYQPEE